MNEDVEPIRKLELPFESIRSMRHGANDVTLWYDPILNCERVGKRIDLLGIDGSIAPEAATMQRINHSNVVQVVAAARVPGYPSPMEVIEIVTPYFPLGSVTDVLLRGDRFLPSEAVAVARSALLGLEELHEVHGLCHRDVKGGNILLSDKRTGLIADLGLAGHMGSDGRLVALENSTLYSPPELITVGRVGRDGDLYSMGLVLLELLGGPFPYDEYTRSAVIDALTRGRIPLKTEDLLLPVWAPTPLERLLRKAIARKPEKRFQRARDMQTALGRVRLLDWQEIDSDVWVAPSGRHLVQVDVSRIGRSLQLSLRLDRGKGMRRTQPAETITGLDDPLVRRAFDTANTL